MPRDEHGNVRRFTGHGEALRWAVVFVAKTFGVSVLPFVLGPVVYFFATPFTEAELPFSSAYVLLFPVLWLGIYVVLVAALYAFTALAGGIMSREEREKRAREGSLSRQPSRPDELM